MDDDPEELERFRWLFARWRERSDFKPEERHNWSYLFNGGNEADLELLAERLRGHAFDVGQPFLSPDGACYVLRATNVQVHTPELLQALCHELGAVADEYGVIYAGFGRTSID